MKEKVFTTIRIDRDTLIGLKELAKRWDRSQRWVIEHLILDKVRDEGILVDEGLHDKFK